MENTATQLRPAPTFMVGISLLIWGWQNDFLLYALLMAILLESSHWQSWRWSVSEKEFNNAADLSSVIFFVLVIYVFNEYGSRGIFTLLSLAPFTFFLLILTQTYSVQGKFKLKALFVSLRKLDPEKSPEANAEVDISLPYSIICLVSASAGNIRTIWFFASICLILSWMLWSCRPKRYHPLLWFGLLVLSCVLGYGGQIGIRKIQSNLEGKFIGLFDHYMLRYRDPSRTTTAIGSIGRLKISDRVVIRVQTEEKLERPLLLREASYSNYGYGVWSAPETSFTVIDQDANSKDWNIGNTRAKRSAKISTQMVKETGVIPLPHGTSKIRDIAAIQIEQNPYGTVNMEIREGWIDYAVDYQNQVVTDAAPREADYYISEAYRADFERLSSELGLGQKTDREALLTIEQHFANNFLYSLNQRHRYPRGKYLNKFLFETRQGHCEFFATSTVLLLRAAGIPARYAVGYSVQEYSPLEGQYVARARHSHSWALAYIEDSWQVIDTTPSTWAPYEDENASPFEALIDLWSWLSYRYSLWQSEDELEQETNNDYLLWLLIPLAGFLFWRLYFKERVATYRKDRQKNRQQQRAGLDSSLYQLVQAFEKAGFHRRTGETLVAWFKRLDKHLGTGKLLPILSIHYRYRFDPTGIDNKLKNEMDDSVKRFIQENPAL